MKPIPFPLNDSGRLLNLLFHDSAAGVQISGDSGGGKSKAMEAICRAVARHVGFLFIDPHGTSAETVYHHCLDLGPSVAERTLYINASDTRSIASINPLRLPDDMDDGLAWGAMRCAKSEQVSKILLAAWGEEDFNSKPVMYKSVYRIVDTLAFTGLSLADAKLFLDTASPLYRPLIKAVPDLMARHEMEELPTMRPMDRESQIGSAKNRFLGFLSNPVIQAIFGKARGALDIERLYRDGWIIIVNLERGGVLREQDQQILANAWLTMFIFCVMSTPRQHRRPYMLFIDELPIFKSSSSLLTAALAQIRKFNLRIVAAHQGTNMFPERTEDRLLHAFVSQCRTHLFFRHGGFADAEFFGKIIELPSIDPKRVKHEHWDKEQYTAGQKVVTLTDEGESTTSTDQTGSSNASALSETQTTGSGTSESDTRTESEQSDQATLLRTAVANAHARSTGASQTHSNASGRTNTQTDSWSHSQSRGRTLTHKQTMVPQFAWRDVLRSVTFYSIEEQFMMGASKLASLATGHAILFVNGLGATHVKFPLVRDPYERVPKFGGRRVEEHRTALLQRGDHDTLDGIQGQRQEMLEALLRELHALQTDEVSIHPLLAHKREGEPDPTSDNVASKGELILPDDDRPASNDEESDDEPWTI